ncbi:MAG: bestrophin-like domain [Rhodanobacter sp.]
MSQSLINPWLYAAGLLLGLLMCVQLGFMLGKRQGGDDGASVLSGAVFGLLGLLLAFSFSGAAGRFAHRHELITQETNAIGTTYLRLDLLPAARQAPLRAAMRGYVQARLDTYRARTGSAAAAAAYARSVSLQQQIWEQATTAAQESGNTATLSLVGSALNEMFDITTTRLAAARDHPPVVIDVMLFVLALMSALLAGYGMAGSERVPWFQVAVFAVALAVTVFVIRDLEYPRLGFIRVDASDHLLLETLHGMKSAGQ